MKPRADGDRIAQFILDTWGKTKKTFKLMPVALPGSDRDMLKIACYPDGMKASEISILISKDEVNLLIESLQNFSAQMEDQVYDEIMSARASTRSEPTSTLPAHAPG